LPGDALHTAYPLTAITERAYALDVVRALEGGDEEVPYTHVNNE
jgi:hypothetical protein